MGILSAVIVGFIVGILARFLMPGRDAAGFLATTFLGMAGAAVAALIGHQMGIYQPDEAAGFLGSVVGAILLLYLYRVIVRHREIPRGSR